MTWDKEYNLAVHSNERFEVVIVDEEIEIEGIQYDGYYAVVNLLTSIVEYKTTSVGDAIVYAENSYRLLRNKPWEWVDKAAQLSAVPVEEFN